MLYRKGNLYDLQGNPIKPAAVRAVRDLQKRALRKLTPAETAFVRLIGPVVKHGHIRYVKQVVFYVAPGISFRSDFVFKDFRVVVEIDGPEHGKPEKAEKDAWRDRLLLEFRDLRTLRLTNEECLDRYLDAREKVVDFLLASPSGFKRYLKEYVTSRSVPY